MDTLNNFGFLTLKNEISQIYSNITNLKDEDNTDNSFSKEIYDIVLREIQNDSGSYSEEEKEDSELTDNNIDELNHIDNLPKLTSFSPFELLYNLNHNNQQIKPNINNIQCNNSPSSPCASEKTTLMETESQKNFNMDEYCSSNVPTVNENFISEDINIINIITGEDKRTMIEVNNIPKKYTFKSFKEEINLRGFKGKYNYLFFEINKKNTKYQKQKAYINFNEPLNIIMFFYLYHEKHFDIKYTLHHKPISKFFLSNNSLNFNNKKFENNELNVNVIEIPKEYLEFYRKIHPKDVCIKINDSPFGIETFEVKQKRKK